ncbi:MAG: hypothetical protein U0528_13415 [Anaerolineae bacterium]
MRGSRTPIGVKALRDATPEMLKANAKQTAEVIRKRATRQQINEDVRTLAGQALSKTI